ncbi:MAG: kynureninase [Chitinophagales bacterium]
MSEEKIEKTEGENFSMRDQFHIPRENGKKLVYFCGNSLGLQPKSTKYLIRQELEDWKNLGVEGHFNAQNPWFKYHHFFKGAAKLVGAKEKEVVLMNSLSVNLHLMLVSFYRPKGNRYKIMMEAGAFPSDQYAVESQVKFHGYDYDDAVIEVQPRKGEHCLRPEDILDEIHKHKEELALVLFSGVQYYTGQFFDLKSITKAAHEAGALAGFDLAHAAGNVPLQLHDWQVDFAVWCTYKYLNSGPGAVGGVFVHEKHGKNKELPRFAGWWGNAESERFKMKKGFVPQEGAAGWQLSNAQVFNMIAHKASLELFNEAGMEKLRVKSLQLTGLLEQLIQDNPGLEIITPKDPGQRGCQLSILTGKNGKKIFEEMRKQGIIADWREPNVIRVAPVPMYNTEEEVRQFAKIINKINA